VFGLIALIYVVDLGRTPVYFEGDEAHFSTIGYSLATTGANLRGETLPVMVDIGDPLGGPPSPWGNTYYQPFLFYLLALTFKMLPFTESTARLPAALIGGVVSPLLIYALASRVIGSRAGALGATLTLALAPIEVLISRRALDYICPLPFVIGWLWCVWSWTRTLRTSHACAAGVVLGCGVYSYISSWFLMPVYLATSAWIFYRKSTRPLPAILAAAAGFALPLVPLIWWIAEHPDMLTATSARYQVAGGQQSALAWTDPSTLLPRLEAYLTFFDPRLWFVFGGPSLTTSTGRAGMFLMPVAILCPLGLYVAWRRRRDALPFGMLLIGLLSAAVPPALIAEGRTPQRAMVLVAFVALTCGFAVDYLWHARLRVARVVVMLAAFAGGLQFAVFYRDYFTHYKLRSAFYLDPVAFAEVASILLQQDGAAAYYFHTELDDAATKWRYYTTKAGRTDLLRRTAYVPADRFPIDEAPAGSLCVIYVDKPTTDALTHSNRWVLVTTVADIDNRDAAAIFRKVP
jgi:hypothetical protein